MAKDSAQDKLRNEIQALKKRNKPIAPQDVLAFAIANPDSECYQRFDRNGLWDDEAAAEKARLAFARSLIMTVKVRVLTPAGGTARVRGIISLSEERNNGAASYRMRADVMSDEERLEKLRRDCARDIETVCRKYADVLTYQSTEALRRVAASVTRHGGGGDWFGEEVAAAPNR